MKNKAELSDAALSQVTGGVFSQDQPSGTPDEMEPLGNFTPSTAPIGTENTTREKRSETDEKPSSPEKAEKTSSSEKTKIEKKKR